MYTTMFAKPTTAFLPCPPLSPDTGKAHHPTARARDRIDSQSWVPDSGYGGETPSMPGSIASSTTSGVGGGGGGAGSGGGGGGIYNHGGGGGWGGGGGGSGGGGWRRSNVGFASAPAQAGYGFGLTAGLEAGMGGDRRALWGCFCSFKTRRKRCVEVGGGSGKARGGGSVVIFAAAASGGLVNSSRTNAETMCLLPPPACLRYCSDFVFLLFSCFWGPAATRWAS